jgi:hypothetical protein
MSLTVSTPVCETGSGSIPNDLEILWEFKDYLDELCARTDVAATFKPRRYQFSDFVLVRFHALLTHSSTHYSAETLNADFSARLAAIGQFVPRAYKDGMRHRRIVPHQTDVDKFFRRLSERDVKTIFGGVLDAFVQAITAKVGKKRSWKFIADNTKFPYYGKRDPKKHIKSPRLPGTKHAWMFQGCSVVSEDLHLFVDFHSLTKGVYRCGEIPDTIQWLQWVGIDPEMALVDREFYRAALVKELVALHVPVLMPTKKYPWVRQRMEQYLYGTAGIVSGNVFTQGNQQYPFQQSVFVRLILIGRDDLGCWEVREQYDQQALSLDKALARLAGFYTTLRPWKNEKAFARYLVRAYKQRWGVETGFRELNAIHPYFRCRTHVQKWADLFMRGWTYDLWQAWAFQQKKRGVRAGNRTRQIFQIEASAVLRAMIFESINPRA